MPVWLLITVLVLGAYRLTRVIVKDDFPPVLWIRDRLVGGWRPLTSGENTLIYEQNALEPRPWSSMTIDGVEHRWVDRWSWVPQWLADLLSCSWCASGWVSLILVAGAAWTVGVPAPVLVWPAVWAAASLITARKWA